MNSRSLKIRHELESLCDQFEESWAGHSIERIAATAAAADSEFRDELLKELIRIDRELAFRADQRIDRATYLEAFPQLELSFEELPVEIENEETQAISASVAEKFRLPPMPSKVGDYKIEEKIGSGGMGVVYRAIDLKLNRTVAIKMMAYPLDEMVPRFESEAAMIAGLSHPGIVKIFEMGTFEGRPYLVLEYVSGGTLDDQIKSATLPPREAAQLAVRLANAIHAAHSVGVIHRDIKPANVLLDAAGQPKLADFGLARQQDAQRQTLSGSLVGTPGFMAPEQATAVTPTTSVDVYGLGGILYSCLTGKPPFRGQTISETLRMVSEQDVAAPSSLQPDIDIDLDSICCQCLQKSPADRYASIAEVAADLQAYLDDRPVTARPPTVTERVSRWCRRNPVIALLSTVLMVAVVAGIAGVFTQWRRANEEVAATRTVVQFMQDAFDVTRSGRDRSVRQPLYSAVEGMDDAFVGRPNLELTVRTTLGDVLRSAEDYQESVKQYRLALALSKKLHGETDQATLDLMDRLAGSIRKSGVPEDLPEAALLREFVLKERKRLSGESHVDTVQAMNNLATVYLDLHEFEKAEAIYNEGLAILDRLPDSQPQDKQMLRYNLVFVYVDNDEFVKAEKALMQILQEMDDEQVSERHVDRLKVLTELADVVHRLKRPDEALKIYRRLLPLKQVELGPASSSTLSTHRRTIRLLNELALYSEASELLQFCLEMHNIKFGRSQGLTLGVRESTVKALVGLGRHEKAVEFQKETVANLKEDRGPDHRYTAKAQAQLDELQLAD